MLDTVNTLKRDADLVLLNTDGSVMRRCVRARNFAIDWFRVGRGSTLDFASDEETMVLLFDAAGDISGAGRGAIAPRRSVSVVPAGSYQLKLSEPGSGGILSTHRRDPQAAVNAASYQTPDPRIAPVGSAWPRIKSADDIRVYEIDAFKAPADNPRLKMLQSATMSINWVDYDGPRDRKALSPHAHADFEQASLAVAGDFVHHLRVPWSKNAEEWREDEHKLAPSPSVLVIPPELIHTTEGVGPGHHLLIDIFAPPRRDFIAKGWVFNAADYRDPTAV
ncbi:MAG: hypothetical protein JO289_02060 [Xanthobacteraceae bacterium]|nr:hypothetical protein [Xanthobacteraceae bacterium]